jgi:hypothetical protein
MVLSGKEWPGYAKGTVPDEGFEWRFIDATPPDIPNRDPACAYIPLGHSVKVLPKGWKKTPENKALDLDIIFEKDVEVTLRDRVRVRFSIALLTGRYMSMFTVPKTPNKRSQQSFLIRLMVKGVPARTSWTLSPIAWVCQSLDKVDSRNSKDLIQMNGV